MKKKRSESPPPSVPVKGADPIDDTPDDSNDLRTESLFQRLEAEVVRGASGLVGGTTDLVTGGAAWAKDQIVGLKDSALDLTDETLTWLRTDPDTDASLRQRTTDLVLSILPVIGKTKDYAEAREVFRRGMECLDHEERELLCRDARRTCTMALVGLHLDIATIGTAGVLARILKIASRTYGALSFSQTVSRISQSTESLPSVDLDMKALVADTLLKIPLIGAVVDQALVAVPDTHRPKPDDASS